MPSATSFSRFKCPGCSADLEFDPKSGAMKCPYCGTNIEIDKIAPPTGLRSVQEHSYDSRTDRSAYKKISEAAIEVTCSGCGAVVQFEPPMVAGGCSFCSAKIVVQPKDADPLLAPDGLLPFVVPQNQATQSVRQWLSSRWFAPNALKELARPEGVHGVYIPFWTFDAQTHTRYQGERGEYYYEQRRINNQVQQVRMTRWMGASGTVDLSFNDLLVPAASSVSPRRLAELEPWDLEKVTPYEPAYLAGFQAQRYQVEVDQGFGASKREMAAAIDAAIREDIGGDEQRIHGVNTDYENVTFKHLMLPVWIGAYKFQSKVYQVAVNARTAEVQGERPYSVIKILLLIVVIVLALIIFSQK